MVETQRAYCKVPDTLRACGGDVETDLAGMPDDPVWLVEQWRIGLDDCRYINARIIELCEEPDK